MFTALKVLLVLIVLVAVVVVVAFFIAPNVTLQNGCGTSVPLPADIPFVGKEIKPGVTTFRVPPGDYQLSRSGDTVRITGPLWIDFTVPAPPQGAVSMSEDGRPIDLSGSSQKISLGPGANLAIGLCSTPR